MDLSDKVFPIAIQYPIDISVDQNTGELILESLPVVGHDQTVRMRFLIEPKAAMQLLSVLPQIQTSCGELIAEKAKQGSLQ